MNYACSAWYRRRRGHLNAGRLDTAQKLLRFDLLATTCSGALPLSIFDDENGRISYEAELLPCADSGEE